MHPTISHGIALTQTPYQCFLRRWSGGCGNAICDGARKCFARGSIPAEVVFIGEGPGESENVLGEPFVGPAGKMLNRIVADAMMVAGRQVPHAFCNLVCCIPRDEEGDKAAEPDIVEIKTCSPRLVQFVRMCRPRLIVCVGKLAEKCITGQSMFSPVDWLPRGQEYLRFASIIHPAAILRANPVSQGVMAQRAVVTLTQALEELG